MCIRDSVRAEQPDHRVFLDSPRRHRASKRVDLRDERPVAGLCPGRGIDERRALEIVCPERSEEVLVDRNVRNLNVGKSAFEPSWRLRFLAITVDRLPPILVSFDGWQATWQRP